MISEINWAHGQNAQETEKKMDKILRAIQNRNGTL